MSWKGVVSGLKTYVVSLVVTILFPLLWLRSVRLARRHADADPRAVAKVAIAIVVSLGIAAVGAFTLLGVHDKAVDGLYKSLDGRLSTALGESTYQSNLETVNTKPATIAIIETKIAEAKANGTDTSELETGLAGAQKELADAQAKVAAFTPNHELYVEVAPLVAAQDDAAAKQLIALSPILEPKRLHEDAVVAFEHKDSSLADMDGWFLYMLWPSLVGAFYAPLAFALGSVLKAGFVPSDTVGFKPYPGGAAGFFLLFGAFGLPSVPFAAWTFMDAENRSVEGQIAL